MSWHQVFPPLSNDPDALEQDRRIRQATRPAAAPSKKDIDQDSEIRALEREARELRIYVAALVRLLGKKGAISAGETSALVALAERVEQDIPPRDRRHRAKLAELIEPRKSVQPQH